MQYVHEVLINDEIFKNNINMNAEEVTNLQVFTTSNYSEPFNGTIYQVSVRYNLTTHMQKCIFCFHRKHICDNHTTKNNMNLAIYQTSAKKTKILGKRFGPRKNKMHFSGTSPNCEKSLVSMNTC